jgi:ketosteroid isomerase-like protein
MSLGHGERPHPGQARLPVGPANATNEQLLRQGYKAFADGDLDTVRSLLADDIVWHNGGANQLAGEYTGPEEVVDLFGQLMEVTGGTFRLDVHDILANDTHGIVLVTVHAERDGRRLDMNEVHIWHLEQGHAEEFWSFAEDVAEMDAFFG